MVSDVVLAGSAVSLQLVGYACLRGSLNRKGRAWLFTLFTSILYSLSSLRSIMRLHTSINDGGDTLRYYYANENVVDRFLIIFLISYLGLDCIIGPFEYKEYLQVGSTWIHHSIFISYSLYILNTNISSVFITLSPVEIPTLVLALGSIIPVLRSDELFGLSFFLFRILYIIPLSLHIYSIENNRRMLMCSGFILSSMMNVYWFYCWCISYRKKCLKG